MCLKIIFKSFLVSTILVSLNSSMVFAENNISNTYLLNPIQKMVNTVDKSELDFSDKLNKLADAYLKNQKSELNNVKWFQGKLIYRENKAPNTNILTEIANRSGEYPMIGRLTIPDVKIDVAIFKTNAQKVVDAKDSAAYFRSGDTDVVADHWYSGFERIRDCKYGTVAYVDTGEKVIEYVCTEVILGHNTGKDLTDLNYVSILTGKNPKGITLYTCVNGWQNVRIAFFEPKW